jgi:transposase
MMDEFCTQAQRWMAAGCFEALAHDLRAVLRMAAGRRAEPSAAIFDSRTLRSTPESGTRAGYDGAKRKRGSKLHMAVDTLGHLLALHITPANGDDRAESLPRRRPGLAALPKPFRACPGAGRGYYRRERHARLCRSEVYRRKARRSRTTAAYCPRSRQADEAKRGFILLPRRWVGERSFAWATRCRRSVKDYECYATTLASLHVIVFVCLMLRRAASLAIGE